MIRFEQTDLNPRAGERRHALGVTLRSPRLWALHGWACVRFIVGYLALRTERRFARDPHRVGKKTPPCVRDIPQISSGRGTSLRFPDYPVPSRPRPMTPASARVDDHEAYLASHRWHACLYGLVDRENAPNAARACVDWLQDPPPRTDAAWEPYSTSERIVNLSILLAAEPAARTAVDDESITTFLDDSLSWVDSHLEYYGPARTNNHILNDARALVVGGAIRSNAVAVEKGLTLIGSFGGQMFAAGGFLRERSSHYQLVVTQWLLDAVHFGRFASDRTSEASRFLEVAERIARTAARATAQLHQRLGFGGTCIGDVSPDCPPELSRLRLERLYPDAAAVRSGDGSAMVDDWLWLAHGDHDIVACAVSGSAFPPGIPTHGHTDVGHFIWRWRGGTVLADAGRARYTKDSESLAQSDGRGHNVPFVNGLAPLAEPLVNGGRWFLEPYSRASVRTEIQRADSFSIAHNGFARIDGVSAYERRVQVVDDGIVVEDRFDGSRLVDLDLLWHFDPEFTPTGSDALRDKDSVVTCLAESSGAQPALQEWQEYVHSAVYGQARRAPLLRYRWRLKLPATITTTLSISTCAASQAF